MERPADAVPYIERTRALYATQQPYRWVEHDPEREPPPWTPITRPLAASRLAVISSGGVHRADQEPFHFRNDVSVREIPLDTDPAALRVAHFGYDVRDARRDAGCVLPLRALRELAAAGTIGAPVPTAVSFMGGIYSARRVRTELAPRLRDFVLRQRADLAYLVPA
ncbi:MAG: glycine/sarcosine/betaine reductase selenoprotein B family protein [Myxococcota bacterium]|nr:glycine/sarcosine/betaine reductase selenoprotein B family protein [Myxococcota bacterium]